MAVETLRIWPISLLARTNRAAEFERMWCPAADPFSRRLPVVMLEQTTQPHLALDRSFVRRCRPVSRQRQVVLGLLRVLFVLMNKKLMLASPVEQDHATDLGHFVSIPVQKQSRSQFQLSPKPVHNPFWVIA